MALKKHEEAIFENLKMMAKTMYQAFPSEEQLAQSMKEMLVDFENKTAVKLVPRVSEAGEVTLEQIDLKQDFVRTRFNTEKSMLSLRAKLSGIAIDVKVIKDTFRAGNKDIAQALADLSAVVQAMPVEMEKHGDDDWSRTPGESPKKLQAALDETPAEVTQEPAGFDEELEVEDMPESLHQSIAPAQAGVANENSASDSIPDIKHDTVVAPATDNSASSSPMSVDVPPAV